MLGSKFPKFLSFLKQQISFSSNFASMSRVMTNNFYILSTKGVYPSTNLVKFYVSSQKSEILHFDGRLLSKSCSFNKKSTEELSLMILKCAAKFKEKLTCCLEYDTRNLVNFHPNTQKSENSTSMGSFCPKHNASVWKF